MGYAWAKIQYDKLNTQTQIDINSMVDAIKLSREQASTLFTKLYIERKWDKWVGYLIRDIVEEFHKVNK